MLPKTLEITTKIGCTNRCVYCPQDVLIKAYNGNVFMSKDQFKKILEHTPKDVQIDFTGFCEPFLNPWASWMMRYSIEQGYRTVLITTLTGFNEKDAEIIDGLEFHQVMVHEFEGTAINMDIFNAKEKLLKESVITSYYERFKLGNSYRWSRAGNLWDVKEKEVKECGWTSKEFYRNVVLPNCDVYLCCMDYGLKHRLGNLWIQHYNELNREIDMKSAICRKCEIGRC